MKEAADALRQKIYDYLFFTSARDVFSIASQGYYPQGADAACGAATPSERPVLRVSRQRANLPACRNQKFIHRQHVD